MIQMVRSPHFTTEQQGQLCGDLQANLSDGKGTCVSHPRILVLVLFRQLSLRVGQSPHSEPGRFPFVEALN